MSSEHFSHLTDFPTYPIPTYPISTVLLFFFQAMKLSNLFFMPYGILFTECHFTEFNLGQAGRYVRSGILVKVVWLFCSWLLAMAYNGNLLVMTLQPTVLYRLYTDCGDNKFAMLIPTFPQLKKHYFHSKYC